MKFVKINKETLSQYEGISRIIYDEELLPEETEEFIFLEVPDTIDKFYILAVNNDGIYSLIENTAAKAQAAKDAQISLLRAQCDADIETQQLAVYGTKNQSAALATQQSWSDIEANPERYVPMMFPTLEDVAFWITPRMAAARQFAAWRFQRIVTRDVAMAEILV
jgi:hypothetical protein